MERVRELIHGQTFLSLCFLHSSDLRPQQSVPVLPVLPTMASKKFGDTRAKFENNLGKIHYKVSNLRVKSVANKIR